MIAHRVRPGPGASPPEALVASDGDSAVTNLLPGQITISTERMVAEGSRTLPQNSPFWVSPSSSLHQGYPEVTNNADVTGLPQPTATPQPAGAMAMPPTTPPGAATAQHPATAQYWGDGYTPYLFQQGAAVERGEMAANASASRGSSLADCHDKRGN